MDGGCPAATDRRAASAWVTEASARFKEAMDAPLASALLRRASAAALSAAVLAAVAEIWWVGVLGVAAASVDCGTFR